MNVNLWFARDENDEIIGVLNSSNDNTYTCPICTSKVIPKALDSKKITPHFAHVDKEKCSSESMLHFWFKHKFIERGDTFTIVSDEKHTYTCKDFKTEVTFNLESGVYRPDIVIETECGNEVVFEMANTNKKKVQDYIDHWIELDKIVVEVDINALTNESDIKEFKALYYNGKCFNFNKRDGGYYNTIGKLKEEMKADGKYNIELVRKLDWFWDTISNNVHINTKELLKTLECFDDSIYSNLINCIERMKCNSFVEDINNIIMLEIDNYICDISKLTNTFYVREFEMRLNKIVIFIYSKLNNGKEYVLNLKLNKKRLHLFNEINNLIVEDVELYNKNKEKLIKEKLEDKLHEDMMRNKYKFFYSPIPSNSYIRSVVKLLNKKFKNIGKVNLVRNSSLKVSGYFMGEKQYRVDYYYYTFSFYSVTDDYITSINLSEYHSSMSEEDLFNSLLSSFNSKLIEYKDGLSEEDLFLLENNDISSKIEKNKYSLKINNSLCDSRYSVSHSLSDEKVNFYLNIKFDYGAVSVFSHSIRVKEFRSFNISKLLKEIVPIFNCQIEKLDTHKLISDLNNYYCLPKLKLYFSNYSFNYEIENGEFNIYLLDSISNEKIKVKIDIENEMIFYNGVPFEFSSEEIADNVFLALETEYYIATEIGAYCLCCNEKFKIKRKEYVSYIKSGWKIPKRCKSCRQKRKQNK